MTDLRQPAEATTEPEPAPDQAAIALCLSGGGLRATLFHLGLLRALRRSTFNGDMALKAVREVYAVSGGSILAGHFLANYPRYVGDDESFEAVEQELLAFADRDLRNRVLRRWPALWADDNPRGRLLQREYDRFLRKLSLGEAYGDDRARPTVHFLATSFTTGALCSFSRTCFEQIDRNSDRTEATPADGIPLAFAVAASSAFPPMFPPIRLTPEALGTTGRPPFNSRIALADGGVFDNFGLDKFCLAQRQGSRPGVLIVSNAGGSFASDPDHQYHGIMSRNIRASDILMRRVGEATLRKGRTSVGDGLILVGIGTTVPDSRIAETTQGRLQLVRTDLDRFGGELAQLLIEHGERVAAKALCDHRGLAGGTARFAVSPAPDAAGGGAPSAARTQALDRLLLDSARRNWRGLLFDFRDFLVLAAWWAIGALAAATLLLLIYSGISYLRAQRDLIKAQTARIELMETQRERDKLKETRLDVVRKAAEVGNLGQIRQAVAAAIDTSEDLAQQPDQSPGPATATAAPTPVEDLLRTPQVRQPPAVGHRQKVYIHFGGALTRAQIIALNQALRLARWQVQGASGDRLPAAVGSAQVKYSGEENKAAAEALAAALNESGLPIRPVSAREHPKIGDNLEVWISR